MSKFSLDDYVDVAERIAQFSSRYPEGSLQGSGHFVETPVVGYLYHAKAYRTPDDPRPGCGTAFEPIPGKTPYTRDSEVQNAETAAWGRAIVALGFETKKIASKQEVQARGGGRTAPKGGGRKSAAADTAPEAAPELLEAIAALATLRDVPETTVEKALSDTFGKNIALLSDVELTMAKARLKAWTEKAQAAA